MALDLLTDNHVHTSWCRHAVGSMEEYVIAARQRGLQRITFLEHLEESIDYSPRTWLTEADFDAYFSEGARLQEAYRGQLLIGLGVEVGYNPACKDTILNRLARRQWDCIGLSFHYCRLPGLPQHLNLLSSKQENLDIIERFGSEKLLCQYLDTLIEAVQTIPAHVLCHLDAGLRHHPGLRLSDTNWQQIDRLLHAVKQADMSLEINTSGYELRDTPFPLPRIIAKARLLGITLVAGSDAHQPADIGRFFNRLPELLS